MGQLHVTRIKQRLNGMFDGLIDMSDASKDAHEKETQFLTRSLAAYAIHRIGKIEPNLAASCVTDGYGDLGIDGVYFDRDRNALVLVQAKWHGKGVSGFDVGGSHKFVDGVRSILNTDIDNANKKIQAMKNDILDAVTDPAVTLQLVPISNAESAFSLEVKQVFEQFQDELNGSGTELASFLRMDQAKIYESLLDKDSEIDLKITLLEWGSIQDPFESYYGQVELDQILGWSVNGDRLFDKNLRIFGGTSSDVFRSIGQTLKSESENLWYYNNGATILCDSVQKEPLYGNSREKGVFHCKGVSVVNGAQTIGSVWEAGRETTDWDPRSRILLRIISLENCPEGFSSKVTKATNTQNRIDPKDFIALDENQWRLAGEFKLDGRRYVYRSGERQPKGDEGCHINEVAPALACLHSLKMAVDAKREVGLFLDPEKEQYRSIFHETTKTDDIWKSVQVMRIVDSELAGKITDGIPRGNLVKSHGNRFILYRILNSPLFRRLKADQVSDNTEMFRKTVTAELDNLACCIEKTYSGSYLQTVFKNKTKCEEIDKELGSSQIDSDDGKTDHGLLF